MRARTAADRGAPFGEELIRTLSRRRRIRLAVLFGSRATGTPRESSDVDIAVEFDAHDSADRYDLLRRTIAVFSRFVSSQKLDVVLLNEASPLLRHRVAKTGKLLYERISGDWERFVMRAIRDYQDTEYQRRYFLDERLRRLTKGIANGRPGDLLAQARRVGRILGEGQGVPEDGSR